MNTTTKLDMAIAIIGIGCFFPKSSGLNEYWHLLVQGQDAITEIPDTHWSLEDYYDADPKRPDHTYCRRGGFLSPVSFDPTEFGIPPATLEATDSSQLLGLIAAKMALDDAGYGKSKPFNRNKTSVILGVTGTQELVIPLGARLGHPIWRKSMTAAGVSPAIAEEAISRIADSYVAWQENSFPGLLGNVVAGRICNRLDLGGTNCVVDAACASSMSALHLAVMELLSGRSDMVVTGGVDTLNDIFMHMCFSKTLILSPTGDVRPFSKDADGTLLGEGIGLLVLKRLEDAEKDRDNIYAVIKAIGSSSDGKSQSIYSPRLEGQARALRMAYAASGVDPDTVELLEAHGTGTRVGDRIEFEALKQVFSESNQAHAKDANWCALGSVKSMIGHTKAAAGAAGLIKAALAIHHKVILPTLKASTPDPQLDIDESPFYLNTEIRPWVANPDHPRRAGVSAFGFGGSNFHAVLEEHRPDKKKVSWDGSVQIFALSALSQSELLRTIRHLKASLYESSCSRSVAFKAEQTRRDFAADAPHRLLVVWECAAIRHQDPCKLLERAEALLANSRPLSQWAEKDIYHGGPGRSDNPGSLAFIFPGQGSQYVGMGRDLICQFPEALAVLEKANEKFTGTARLNDVIYPKAVFSEAAKRVLEETLRRTENSQPAIGATSLAMFKILQRFGLAPDATFGHSFGELTALCAAGWLTEEDLLHLAVARGRCMAQNGGAGGSMLAVNAPLDQLDRLIQTTGLEVTLANRNSPNQGVLSGAAEAIEQAQNLCRDKGYSFKKLAVSAAFHSSLIGAAQKPFKDILAQSPLTPNAIPVFSNTTGKAYPLDPEKARQLLAEQLVQPVDFISGIENLYQSGIRTFVEVGPKSHMTGLIKSILQDTEHTAFAMDSSAGRQAGMVDLARTLSHLAASGHRVDLTQWEQPVSEPRKQLMNIPISGVNYRSLLASGQQTRVNSSSDISASIKSAAWPEPQTPPKSRAAVIHRFFETPQKPARALPPVSDGAAVEQPGNLVAGGSFMNPTNASSSKPMPSALNKHSEFVLDALKVVQEGLKSMQTLQMETAATHKKFLETQTEASRTLQEMMKQTQRLTESALGLQSPAAYAHQSTVQTLFDGIDPAPFQKPLVRTHTPTEPQDPDALEKPLPDAPNSDQLKTVRTASRAKEDRRADIGPALLEVISRLTGYPVEMLAMEMDIESDLGIDSIKRVEILSSMEEALPDLPKVSPDLMGSLKTLGQIVDYLAGPSTDKAALTAHRISGALKSTKPSDSAQPSETPQTDIARALLEVISRLTGYPVEMLAMEMDIESDLGIDSIKRVEILSSMEEALPDLPKVSPDLMGSLKTLGQIVDYLAAKPHGASGDENPSDIGQVLETTDLIDPDIDSDHNLDTISRKIITVVDLPESDREKIAISSDTRIYIAGDEQGLGRAIAEACLAQNIDAVSISSDMLLKNGEFANAAGLVILPDSTAAENPEKPYSVDNFIKKAFLMSQKAAPALLDAARNGGAMFAAISRLDGAFGFNGRGVQDPLQGGLAGLAKTAALEWPGICCHAFDISPEWQDNQRIAAAVVSEMLQTGPVEVGLSSDRKVTLALQSESLPGATLDLNSQDVVLISGGARGVTASVAYAIAKCAQPIIILMGRSPEPSSEPAWLASLTDEGEIKKAIYRNEFDGQTVSPVQIEHAFRQRMAQREIRATLQKLQSAGSMAFYHTADVRNAADVEAIIRNVRATYGPITGLIHGAGVLEDRMIVDKTAEQFEKVFGTKVHGLQVLLNATQQDPLKYLVLFSSITARMGNRGQVDYAMANEVLNKIAQNEAIHRTDCRVVSINWGPWDGGMVSNTLKRQFRREGVELMSLEMGAKSMLHEMMAGVSGPVEVVIGAPFASRQTDLFKESDRSSQEKIDPAGNGNNLALTIKHEVDLNRFPILQSHILAGKPVVPFALIAEWLGHGALHENPGLLLAGIEDIRLLKGIRLDEDKKVIRLLAGKARRKGSNFEVDVEIRNGVKEGREVIHSRAKAILTDKLSQPPIFDKTEFLNSSRYLRSVEEVYAEILFHGVHLRGIREITHLSSRGMTARVASAPPPQAWIKEPTRSKWIGDPLVLDSAFQMAIVWCFEKIGIGCLPSYTAAYRQFCAGFPQNGVTAVLEVTQTSQSKMTGNFTFLDADHAVIATLHGYEATMDPALLKAFKPEALARA